MPDGVLENAPFILAGVVCIATAAWFVARRCAAKNRACRCRYCPRCGLDISLRMSGRGAVPQARRVSTVVDAPRAAASEVLPSAMLKSGWSRTVQPAADAAGHPVFSDSPNACRFTLWAAGNRAFPPGSRRWRSFFENLESVLLERYGGVTVLKWNRAPARTQSEVVAVAAEAERMMQQHSEQGARLERSL